MDEVRNDDKLVSLILLMTLKPVGVDDLEGGGSSGPDSNGSQQLDVLVLVVERHQSPLTLVLPEQIVNVTPAAQGQGAWGHHQGTSRAGSDWQDRNMVRVNRDLGKTVDYWMLEYRRKDWQRLLSTGTAISRAAQVNGRSHRDNFLW